MAATAHVLHGSHRDMRWLLGPVMRDALRVWCPILKCKKCKKAKFAIKNAFITLQKQNRRTLRGTYTLQ